MLSVLDFLKALWEGAAQYTAIVDKLKNAGNFWKHLTSSIALSVCMKEHRPEKWREKDTLSLTISFHCQVSILEVMAYDIFLQKKLSLAESTTKQTAESKDNTGNSVSIEKSIAADKSDSTDIFIRWSEDSILEDLVKIYSSCDYDAEVSYRAKVTSVTVIYLMFKLFPC